jgi:hypothetical protein
LIRKDQEMRTRTKRSLQPELTGLEGRQLLSTVGSPSAVDRTSLGSRALLDREVLVAAPKAGHTSHAAAEGVKAVDRTSRGSRALYGGEETMVATHKAGHTSHAARETSTRAEWYRTCHGEWYDVL